MAPRGKGKFKGKSSGDEEDWYAEASALRPNDEPAATPPQHPHKATTSSWADNQRQPRGKKEKQELTHFLCIPLVNYSSRESIQKSLQHFREDALSFKKGEESEQDHSAAVPVKAVRPIGTLHLTLGVMRLANDERIADAISFLQNLDLAALLREASSEEHHRTSGPLEPQEGSSTAEVQPTAVPDNHLEAPAPRKAIIPDPSSTADSRIDDGLAASPGDHGVREPASASVGSDNFKISLRSLAAMQNPSRTTVLYALPEAASPSFPFYAFCSKMRSVFTDATFLKKEDRPLKLHATVVNTIYAKSGGRHGPSRGNAHSRGPPKIDATELIERYKDFCWAENVTVEKVAICKMGAKKIRDDAGEVIDEQYEEVASCYMPGIPT